MKVLNLRCAMGHSFEGWFASEEDYATQQERQLIACPLCNSNAVQKMPSAPRLNLGAQAREHSSGAGASDASRVVAESAEAAMGQQPDPSAQAMWLHTMRKAIANAEDVGNRFAHEARKIHQGESPDRSIRGQASAQEAQQLLDEGIGVVSLPDLFHHKLQ